MNSIAEVKTTLHQYIAETDDLRILTKVQKYVIDLLDKEETIIAFNSRDVPMTQKEYKRQIDEIILQVDGGELISQEEMERGL